jgi:hypothetical protein
MARVNFSPGRIEFFAKEWTKTVKICTLGIAARNIFLVFEKGKRFS